MRPLWPKALLKRLFDWLAPETCEEIPSAAAFIRRNAPKWTAEDDKAEEALYMQNTYAFWLRPDRHKFAVPCWAIEVEYAPSKRLDVGMDARMSHMAYLQAAAADQQFRNYQDASTARWNSPYGAIDSLLIPST